MLTLKDIPVSDTAWLSIGPTYSFRRSLLHGIPCLWRKEYGQDLFGGYRITRCFEDSPIANEWLMSANR